MWQLCKASNIFVCAIFLRARFNRCDVGYSGSSCETTVENNPTSLYEDFENDLLKTKWLSIIGGTTSSNGCGTISSGRSLYFNGVKPQYTMAHMHMVDQWQYYELFC